MKFIVLLESAVFCAESGVVPENNMNHMPAREVPAGFYKAYQREATQCTLVPRLIAEDSRNHCKTMDEHWKAVAVISSSISSFYQRKVPFRLYHGATNSTQHRQVDPKRMVDTSGLNHVLRVDTKTKTCLVEPNVPMDELVDATLPYGLVPEVVMEFPGITVGGGFSGMSCRSPRALALFVESRLLMLTICVGTAGESSGFKFGFFENTVQWIEIVLPTGEVVNASPSDHSDLFYGAAGTFGTLGVTTLLELRLIEAKRYVDLTYHPVTSIKDALSTMKTVTQDETNDYVDGILYSKDRGVIVTGKLTEDRAKDTKVQQFSKAHNPWFFIHAFRSTRYTDEPVKTLTPVKDYLFRYDRGAFWVGIYAFRYFMTPFNRITRYLLDYFMHTRVMYHALHASGHATGSVIQDLLLPVDTVQTFIEFVSDEFGFWPLWLCPFTVDREISLHPRLPTNAAGEKERHFVNVGVWHPGLCRFEQFVILNRKIERKVRELGGVKWLYAQPYYTEDEFDEIYDREWYDALREKYHATYLPTVYDKVKVDLAVAKAHMEGEVPAGASWYTWLRIRLWNVWPVSGLYGVWKTVSERDYLLAK